MPKVSIIEKRIFEIEGFQVDIAKDGKNVRGDMQLPKQYEAERMTKNSMTVGDWKSKFKTQYPGYDVVVYKNNGEKASGQTKLATVRDTYLDDQN
ncbi:hypothetical protein [Coprococcus ammoniilyticus]|jgi:hypothetical protein|uniref:Uncharacterized protein n=2 Tax=Clostridia TaxID=186801 RepID=A0ABV1ED33_9FIRM